MKTAWKAAVGVLAGLLVLMLIAEAGVRMFMANQIERGVEQGQEVSVAFGPSPVTLDLLTGKLPHLTVRTGSTLVVNGNEIYGQPASEVEMDRVRIVQGEPIAESFTLSTELPNEFLRATINQQISQAAGDYQFINRVINVSEVTTNPEAGTFTIEFTGGAAGVELKPVNTGGQFTFEAQGTQLFGIDLPDEVAQSLSDAMSEGLQQQTAGEMHVQDMQVIPGGLVVHMGGANVNFAQMQRELAQQQQPLPAGIPAQ